MGIVSRTSTQISIKAPANKVFDLFANQSHQLQNLCETVHATKLQEGDDWRGVGKSVKQWTYVVDGKTQTCNETVEDFDEQNKKITYKAFGGDIDQQYKLFRIIVQVIDIKEGGGIVKYTIEYENKNEGIAPPNGFIEHLSKCTRDIDAHLAKA